MDAWETDLVSLLAVLPGIASMTIQLTKPELEKFIDEQIRQGKFTSAADVIEAGLARLMVETAWSELDEETQAAIDRADAQFDRGDGKSFKEFAADFRSNHLKK
jgi:putative addiction module CopG family antidote